ncbi:Imidazole glycerol phosphate synthase subunit HisF [Candidatus Hodgkinia cicadicola]|uniref:Imidazole glycerol phosphate synthase subunit HisF n=1 Tax=Candidatus Hodgkinia cicadicola TaxID=573658 RepID=A0ABX4MHA6_9HYPH|nr:Imidazole glycerol phosphate synthase subunit HisF [Candidatus Hodgkinia cicadicola]
MKITSLSVRIIPCIDVNYNRVVKGTRFSDLTSIGSPTLLANKYSVSGADELCFLNIAASAANKMILYDTISRISESCFIPLTVGGGVRKIKDVGNLLKAGADKVAINSASIANPKFIANCVERFGSQCIVSSVDCKAINGTWEVVSHSGLRSTGIDALDHICKLVQYGVGEILLTSIDRDGTNDGYDIALLKSVSQLVNVPIIASGGGSEFRHVASAIIEGGASAVLLASALHHNRYSISQLKYFLGKCGILVRDDYINNGLLD